MCRLTTLLRIAIVLPVFALPLEVAYAGPASSNYELKSYSFGAGGGAASSSNYSANGTVGELEFGQPSSTNFKVGSGLTFAENAGVPPAPTLANIGTNYERLHVTLQTGGSATDTTYAIEISTDNFVSDIRYIKSDETIGTSLAPSDFQTYSSWGSSSGFDVTGLSANTTYSVRAAARQGAGSFTQSAWGPASSSVTTSTPSLTFSVSSDSVTFTHLNSGNAYTDSSQSTILTTSTNAYNGYVVNARETGPLTGAATAIADFASPNAAPTVWTGAGFGYTTSDSDLSGGTADRFTAGGPKYAGFTTSSPGDPVADHAGPVTSPISNEQFTISYYVKATTNTSAGKYTTTILYNVVPEY
jgi:hypothetical protein